MTFWASYCSELLLQLLVCLTDLLVFDVIVGFFCC